MYSDAEKLHIIQSPLNYTGGKYKLLRQMLPHFPKQIDTFVDLFCGGGNVGININAKKVIFNDNNQYLLNLFVTFKKLGYDKFAKMVDCIITKYGLSQSTKNGYAYYNCDSSIGLGDFNREPFLQLRDDFNKKKADANYYAMLYVLIVFSFNNQIRFNSKGEFNLPIGKRDFNDKMKAKLRSFINKLQGENHFFSCEDFRKIDTSTLTEQSLVYCDPPYLITCATYNEQDGWNKQSEQDLLNFLDKLNKRDIKFALSNVLSSKGKKNDLLEGWLSKRSYKTIHLNYSYSNSNYQTKDKTTSAEEVLIINY